MPWLPPSWEVTSLGLRIRPKLKCSSFMTSPKKTALPFIFRNGSSSGSWGPVPNSAMRPKCIVSPENLATARTSAASLTHPSFHAPLPLSFGPGLGRVVSLNHSAPMALIAQRCTRRVQPCVLWSKGAARRSLNCFLHASSSGSWCSARLGILRRRFGRLYLDGWCPCFL
jgi:hypothetical protein